MPLPPIDYLVHWGLELLGGGACTCAIRWCPHRYLRTLIWLIFSIVSTILTVQVVG